MFSNVMQFESDEDRSRKDRARFFFESYLDSGNDYNLYEAIKQATGSQITARSMTWGSEEKIAQPANRERF